MTILREINIYYTNAKTYWDNQIDNSSYTNKDELKSTVATYLTNLNSAYETYKNSLDKSIMTNLILALYYYLMQKYQIQIDDPNCPSIDELDFILTDLYHNWTYELPDYAQLFILSDDPNDSTKGIIELTNTYNQLKNNIESNFAQEDNTQIKTAYIPTVASKSTETNLYRIIKQPKFTIVDNVDIKSKLLNDFKLQDIMDEFGWTWAAFE